MPTVSARLDLTMNGIVQEVDAASGRLDLLVHGVPKTFSVPAGCGVDLNGILSTLAEVQPGDRVRVDGTAQAGTLQARAIRLERRHRATRSSAGARGRGREPL